MYTIKTIIHTKQGERTRNLGRFNTLEEASGAMNETIRTVEAGLYTGEEVTQCEIIKM